MAMQISKQTGLLIFLAFTVAVAQAFYMWHQSSMARQTNQKYMEIIAQLQHENSSLRQSVSEVKQPENTPAAESAPVQPQGAPSMPQAKAPPETVPTPTGYAPAPRATGLALAETRVEDSGGVLKTTMRFTPTTTEPLGIVAMVVRLPRESDSKILDLAPAGDLSYTEVSKRVAEDGKFAIFQGTPESVAAVEIALSVSGAAVADVRGTCGIGPFDLTMDPSGASTRTKK